MQIWPSVDIRGGNCVRLVQGDVHQETIYGDSPADMAARFVADGATGIHVVDLDGAHNGLPINFEAIETLAQQVDVPIQVGGGIRSTETIERYLEAGINRLIIGTRAISDLAWTLNVIDQYPDSIMISLNVRDGLAAAARWDSVSNVSMPEFVRNISQHPIAGIVYTDITRDGMLTGPNFEAIKELNESASAPLITSGGISSQEDVARLSQSGIAGCVIGRALYDGHLTLAQAMTASEAGALGT